jgi:transposase
MSDGSWVGVDLHARSAVAGVLDGVTGELRTLRVPAAAGAPVDWLLMSPAPVRLAYEAGPSGFGLARVCAAAGITCLVAAPGKIPRAAAERVETDRRDTERLARLLRLETAVRVPDELEEAARDLVRARCAACASVGRSRSASTRTTARC